MSVQAMTWAWETKCPNPSSKLVLMCLANYANKSGKCFPGQKTVAEDCGISVRTVKTAMQSLVDAGLITKHRRERDDGTRTSDEYFLQFDKVQISHEDTGDKVQNTSGQGAKSAYHEPVREPSEKKKIPKKKNPRAILETVLSPQTAADVIEHRQRLRKPLTCRAAELMVKQFEQTANPCEAADLMIERGWQSFKAEWAGKVNGTTGASAQYRDYVMKTQDEKILSFAQWSKQHGQN